MPNQHNNLENVDNANRAHGRNDAFFEQTNAAAISTGTETVKALLLIQGGACVACLAFAGQVLSSGKLRPEIFPIISEGISKFAIGALLCALSLGAAWIANFCTAISSGKMRKDWNHPFVHDTMESVLWHRLSMVARFGTIILYGISIWCFFAGINEIKTAISRF